VPNEDLDALGWRGAVDRKEAEELLKVPRFFFFLCRSLISTHFFSIHFFFLFRSFGPKFLFLSLRLTFFLQEMPAGTFLFRWSEKQKSYVLSHRYLDHEGFRHISFIRPKGEGTAITVEAAEKQIKHFNSILEYVMVQREHGKIAKSIDDVQREAGYGSIPDDSVKSHRRREVEKKVAQKNLLEEPAKPKERRRNAPPPAKEQEAERKDTQREGSYGSIPEETLEALRTKKDTKKETKKEGSYGSIPEETLETFRTRKVKKVSHENPLDRV
jgi:hypothetical protein